MAVTFTNLETAVLSLLDEQSTSTVAALKSGTGAADTETSQNAILRHLNDGNDLLAETAVLLPITATSFAVAADVRTVALSALTVASPARSMRAARQVVWTPTATGIPKTLTYTDWNAVRNYDTNYTNAASGTLSKWFNDAGNDAIVSFYLPPSGDGAVLVSGYGLPVALTTGTTSIPWLPDGWADALAYYAAGMIALKGMSDPENAVKESRLLQEWDRRRLIMLSEQDPAMAKRFLRRDPALEPVEERRKVINRAA